MKKIIFVSNERLEYDLSEDAANKLLQAIKEESCYTELADGVYAVPNLQEIEEKYQINC